MYLTVYARSYLVNELTDGLGYGVPATPLGKAQKCSCLSGLATKAFSPPPPRLSGHRNFFPFIKKSYFSFSFREICEKISFYPMCVNIWICTHCTCTHAIPGFRLISRRYYKHEVNPCPGRFKQIFFWDHLIYNKKK